MAGKSFTSGGVTLEAQSNEDMLLVESYGDGGFRLLGRRVQGGVLVLSAGFYPIEAKTAQELSAADFELGFNAEEKPELVLIGTGEKMQLVPSALRQALEAAGIGYDVMDTGAAARTYNVLLIEGRRVSALLLPVD
ncbi:Mth938-like domain-containing protein [Kordiimonas gwangyangensis]|uniref:Mth938-like domain-containing protein n=1 Tax=Kordiimonas gwangyangensis TaxID=288022 RepID=UPI000373B8B7|nr:Mth938-like domain-containing protein [Kordiimonas gwangyangensis]